VQTTGCGGVVIDKQGFAAGLLLGTLVLVGAANNLKLYVTLLCGDVVDSG
jgi:hypothetical protein